MKVLLNKEFYKNNLIYLIPMACSFLFFWKLSVPNLWYDELVTLRTVYETTPYEFISNYLTDQLHPPLYFFVMKFYLYLIDFLVLFNYILVNILYFTVHSLNNIFGLFHLPPLDFQQLVLAYFSDNYLLQLKNITEGVLRFPSAIFLTAVNIIIFHHFKKNKMPILGFIICLLIGTNNKIIYYAQEARPYALFVLTFILVVKEYYKRYNDKLTLSGFKKLLFLNALMMLTHFYSIFVVGAELAILLVVNRKNTKVRYVGVLLFSLFTIFFLFGYDFFNFQRLNISNKFSYSDLKEINLSAMGYFVKWPVYFFYAIGLLVKKRKNKFSNADFLIFKGVLFLVSVLVLVIFYGRLRPIYQSRYILFVIPLQIIIISSIFYSIGEAIFIFINNRIFKSILVASVLIYFTGRLITAEYFYFFGYNQEQKFYPIQAAFEAITRDKDYKENRSYVLEEYHGTYFKFYEDKFGLNQLANLDPTLSNPEKESRLIPAIINTNIFYYIKIRLNEGILSNEVITPSNYTKKMIFQEDRIQVFKFIKAN